MSLELNRSSTLKREGPMSNFTENLKKLPFFLIYFCSNPSVTCHDVDRQIADGRTENSA